MLQLQQLTLCNFRSYRKLVWQFRDGLTLLLGPNGAGKTAVRYGVQYALTGSIPGYTKAELRNDAAPSAPMYASLDCVAGGKTTNIYRAFSKTTITQDGETFGVREASFLEPVKKNAQFVFLSAEQSHFIDVQEYRRKQMLNNLIKQVGFLRNDCTQRAKDFQACVYNRRTTLLHQIETIQVAGEELRQAQNDAEHAVRVEEKRLAGLRELAAAGLPFTHTERDEKQRRLDAVHDRHGVVDTYVRKTTTWVADAHAHNRRVRTAHTGAENKRAEIANIEELETAVQARKADVLEALVCPSCDTGMVCASCNTPYVAPDKQGQLDNELRSLATRKARAIDSLKKLQAEIAKDHALIDEDVIAQTEAALQQYRQELDSLCTERAELTSALERFDLAVTRAQELNRFAEAEGHLEQLQVNLEAVKERVAYSAALVQRKTKAVDVLAKKGAQLNAAITVLYDQMPAVYYNLFLQKLELYTQFLLGEISDMTISLSASADGISVLIDGKRKVHQLSTGQRQRVRIATTLAFAFMSTECDTLFIDEVFDTGLDEEGVALFAQLINTHMRKHFSKIVLVSHRQDIAMSVGADYVYHAQLVDGESTVREVNNG